MRVLLPTPLVVTEPIYNMVPPGSDVVARFGFFAVGLPGLHQRPGRPDRLQLIATIEGAPRLPGLIEAMTTLWGVPARRSHDEERITPLEANNGRKPSGGRAATVPEAPFLSNPTDCSLQRQVDGDGRSYQLPDQPVDEKRRRSPRSPAAANSASRRPSPRSRPIPKPPRPPGWTPS